jgi:dTDP-4-amino-4,6-dideoxygalactose transaminase
MQAAIAREQLKKLDEILATYDRFAYAFPVKVRPGCEPAYYRYAWTDKETTDEQANYLNGLYFNGKQFNIKRHYIKPIFQMPLFQHLGYQQDQCPVCREVDEDIILAWPKEII